MPQRVLCDGGCASTGLTPERDGRHTKSERESNSAQSKHDQKVQYVSSVEGMVVEVHSVSYITALPNVNQGLAQGKLDTLMNYNISAPPDPKRPKRSLGSAM